MRSVIFSIRPEHLWNVIPSGYTPVFSQVQERFWPGFGQHSMELAVSVLSILMRIKSLFSYPHFHFLTHLFWNHYCGFCSRKNWHLEIPEVTGSKIIGPGLRSEQDMEPVSAMKTTCFLIRWQKIFLPNGQERDLLSSVTELYYLRCFIQLSAPCLVALINDEPDNRDNF